MGGFMRIAFIVTKDNFVTFNDDMEIGGSI